VIVSESEEDRRADPSRQPRLEVVEETDSELDRLEQAIEASVSSVSAVGSPLARIDSLGGEQGEDRLVGQVLDGRYRVLARIDSGGIGAVYEAEQLQLKRRVAVKVLHTQYAQNTEFRQRFEREALAASKATHPSCVAVLDLGTVEDRPYLVMEFVEGELLTDLMKRDWLTPKEAVVIGLKILEALRHAHRHGIVHRDVKPDNVMLCHPDETGTQVKLLDFGLAKNLVPDAPGGHAVTQSGTVCGTPSYMSPEQGIAAEVDARSDLYSCGVVLYQMACGRKPFVHEEMVELIQAHLTESPPRPREVRPELSLELEAVLLRALQKKRNARFQSADEFIDALQVVPESGQSGEEVTTLLRDPEPEIDRERLATAATVHANVDALVAAMEAPTPAPTQRRPGWQLVGLLVVAMMVASGMTLLLTHLYPEPGLRSPELRKATRLLAAGKLTEAEQEAHKAIKRRREDGHAHMVLGHIYHRKLWLSDAIKEYRRALAHTPELRDDPTILGNVIEAMRHRKVARKAMRFLVKRAGRAAIPALQRAKEEHEDPQVRLRAGKVLEQIDQPRRRRP
jgi:serine/threonine-protein kinase